MKSRFPGYFRPTEAEFRELWRDALIVPDANVLLNLVRYDAAVRNEVLAALRTLQAQLWVPYQAGLEFLRNWRGVDADNRAAYAKVRDDIRKAEGELTKAFERAAKHQTIDAKGERERIAKFIQELIASLDQAEKGHPDRAMSEAIVQQISDLIGDAIGEKPSAEDRKAWLDEGRKRYEAKIPPGYEDAKKDGEAAFGDLLLWREVMCHAKEVKRPVIFITDERKEDWIEIVRGQQIGPRPELVEEFRAETGQRYYSYSLTAFLKAYEEHTKSEVSEETIAAIQEDEDARKSANGPNRRALTEQESLDVLMRLRNNNPATLYDLAANAAELERRSGKRVRLSNDDRVALYLQYIRNGLPQLATTSKMTEWNRYLDDITEDHNIPIVDGDADDGDAE